MKVSRRWACCGCLGFGALVVVAIPLLWLALVQWRLPERAGLVKPVEQRLLGGAANPAAAEDLRSEMAAAGMSTQGLQVAVVPVKGRDYNLAIAVLDASQGFSFSGGGDTLLESFKVLALSPSAEQHQIGRVALHYIDDQGNQLLGLTAPTTAIRSYADGQLDEQAFLQAIEGEVNFQALYQQVTP